MGRQKHAFKYVTNITEREIELYPFVEDSVAKLFTGLMADEEKYVSTTPFRDRIKIHDRLIVVNKINFTRADLEDGVIRSSFWGEGVENRAVFDGGVKGFDPPPQEVADPPESSATSLGIDSNPLRTLLPPIPFSC